MRKRRSLFVGGALVVALVGSFAGCAQVLGIEHREHQPPPPCTTTFDCAALGPGVFCNAGVCSAGAPVNTHCHLAEPEIPWEQVDWSMDPLLFGTVGREHDEESVPHLEAMQLAVREINANGGVGAGRQVLQVRCDFGGSTGDAAGADRDALLANAVQYFGAELATPVITGHSGSSATQVSMDRIMGASLPVAFISSYSTSTQLTDYKDRLDPDDPFGLLWRTAVNDAYQAQVLAQLIHQQAAVSTVAIAYIKDQYGEPLQVGINQALADLQSAKQTTLHPFAAGTTDFSDLVAAIAAQGADGLLVIALGGETVIDIYQEVVAQQLSLNAYFLADGTKTDKLLAQDQPQAIQDMVALAHGTAPYHSTGPHYQTFAVNLDGEFGHDAGDFSFLAQAYDAAYMAAYGLAFADASGADRDGRSVTAGFAQLISGADVKVGATTWNSALAALTSGPIDGRTIDIDGTSGPLDFDPATGDAPGPIEVWRAEPDLSGFRTCESCQIIDDALECEQVTDCS